MKVNLDENLGQRGQEMLRAGGHDVSTVAEGVRSLLTTILRDLWLAV